MRTLILVLISIFLCAHKISGLALAETLLPSENTDAAAVQEILRSTIIELELDRFSKKRSFLVHPTFNPTMHRPIQISMLPRILDERTSQPSQRRETREKESEEKSNEIHPQQETPSTETIAQTTSKKEITGYVEIQSRSFLHDPLYPYQNHDTGSIAIEPGYYYEWNSGSSFTFTGFGRYDSADNARTHADVRELNFLWLNTPWEIRAGIGKVFWGVTETQHLVDIVNQTDLVESPDGEEKLGQPMVKLSLPSNQGTLDLFLLPYFRERTFPGKEGRLRNTFHVDTDQALYENSQKQSHVDGALRFSHYISNLDFGLSYFYGTSRDPVFVLGESDSGDTAWIPYYEIIHQGGLDLQYAMGNMLWKSETIYRSGQDDDDFFALTKGFEYTFYGLTSQNINIGLLCEWLYDERGEKVTTPYDNDIMFGLRVSLNDQASTEFLLGAIEDIDSEGSIFFLESNRRLSDSWKMDIRSYFIVDASNGDSIYPLREDSYVELGFKYYY